MAFTARAYGDANENGAYQEEEAESMMHQECSQRRRPTRSYGITPNGMSYAVNNNNNNNNDQPQHHQVEFKLFSRESLARSRERRRMQQLNNEIKRKQSCLPPPLQQQNDTPTTTTTKTTKVTTTTSISTATTAAVAVADARRSMAAIAPLLPTEPDPYLASGQQLPPALVRQMPAELIGKPIEDIDPFYADKEVSS